MAYVQHTPEDIRHMLEVIGAESIESLFESIPSHLHLDRDLMVPERRSEPEILRQFQELSDRNVRMDSMPWFLGAGVYNRFIPAAIDYLVSRGELLTAYTPYQPEVSQGTLQIIFEYQTLMARLTGMEISNASMYEAGTALAEAAMMAYTINGKGKVALVSAALHPEYRQVLETYFKNHPIELRTIPLQANGRLDSGSIAKLASAGEAVFAIIGQSPNFFGIIEDNRSLRATIDDLDGVTPFFIQAVDPVSLGVLEDPGSYGADIVVGDGQSLGNDPNLGGPSFGFFATRASYVRKIPGRIVGETRDKDGKRGYVLTFQTREQHIRRARATSNICTNQGICCLRGAMALTFLGAEGIRETAELSARMAQYACHRLLELPDVHLTFEAPFFQEFVLEFPHPGAGHIEELLDRGIRGGLALDRFFPERDRQMMFAVTELTTKDDAEALCSALGDILTTARSGASASKSHRPSSHTSSDKNNDSIESYSR